MPTNYQPRRIQPTTKSFLKRELKNTTKSKIILNRVSTIIEVLGVVIIDCEMKDIMNQIICVRLTFGSPPPDAPPDAAPSPPRVISEGQPSDAVQFISWWYRSSPCCAIIILRKWEERRRRKKKKEERKSTNKKNNRAIRFGLKNSFLELYSTCFVDSKHKRINILLNKKNKETLSHHNADTSKNSNKKKPTYKYWSKS